MEGARGSSLILLPPVPLNKPSTHHSAQCKPYQDRVTLAQTLGLTRSDPDYHPLRLGNTVLGGSFYATRLCRDLREYAGLVYYVSSSFQMSKTRGIYVTEYACDPPNVSKARAIILKNLRTCRIPSSALKSSIVPRPCFSGDSLSGPHR